MIGRLGAFINRNLPGPRRRDAYRHVFLSPEGRIVLADLARWCQHYADLGQSESDAAMRYLLGRRAAYLYILGQLDEPPEVTLQAEADGLDQFEESA